MSMKVLGACAALASCCVLAQGATLQGQVGGPQGSAVRVFQDDFGLIHALDAQGLYLFQSWSEYAASDFFQRNNLRCGGGLGSLQGFEASTILGLQADCTNSSTNPAAQYAPSVARYRIPVVVHVLMSSTGQGAISDAMVQSQIDILNQDFLALPGSNGAPGTDVQVEFYLATTDPSGNPTTGITRTTNTTWFNDGGTYYSTLAWDTNNYLNIYTNTAGGNLGYAYVPNGGGVVGNSFDRVVILWSAFGNNAPIGAPYNKGRTTTHEVGHYLGLQHTFQGGCAGTTNCYANGDLICDTLPESQPNFGCSQTTCGDPDPVTNYMDYSEDLCMNNFTSDQTRRMRCTLESWRVNLAEIVGGGTPPGQVANPAPANGATGVSTLTSLSWTAAAGATSYDVYFGTDSTPDASEFLGTQASTSFAPGTLLASTTYYWTITAGNSNGSTAGPVWSFTTGSTATTVVLFNDTFETGNLTAGGWTAQNTNAFASSSSAFSGAWGLRVRQTSWAQKSLSTVGYNTIRLLYNRRTSGMDSTENLYVEWYNGSVWSPVETTKTTTWGAVNFALPAGAANNASFRVRFRTNCSLTSEHARIDNVQITGVTN